MAIGSCLLYLERPIGSCLWDPQAMAKALVCEPERLRLQISICNDHFQKREPNNGVYREKHTPHLFWLKALRFFFVLLTRDLLARPLRSRCQGSRTQQ